MPQERIIARISKLRTNPAYVLCQVKAKSIMTAHPDDSNPPRRIAARRDYHGPAFLAQGFRPFFLGAGIWAVVALSLWLGEWLGILPPSMALTASWHAHEMLFGFASAAMGGFLLTAIPNWTGRLPVRGLWLGMLALFWLAGRLVMLMTTILDPLAVSIVDSLFLVLLSIAVWREIIAGKNWRNIKTALAITLLAIANILFHWQSAQTTADTALAERMGVMVLIALMALIGGRIIPSFTRNVLRRRGADKLPAVANNLDRACLAFTVITAFGWTFYPQNLLVGVLTLIAALLHFVRLGRWRGLAILNEPILWVMHLGYLWISIGFGLLGMHIVLNLVPQSAGIHALTAGAFGTMILGVMSRATRGHSGAPLIADGATTTMYIAVSLAALVRVIGSITNVPLYYAFSGGFWVLAFGIFVIAYWKMLTSNMRALKT
jgi:uncharacterized protein involved in response to NO